MELERAAEPPFCIHESHVDVVLCGGYAGCLRCCTVQAYGTGGRLAQPCRGDAPRGPRGPVSKLCRGTLPHVQRGGRQARRLLAVRRGRAYAV